MARDHIVVSGHYLTAQAGFQILEAGGNAVDAGVAVGIATGVVECNFVGFGGIAPSLIHLADRNETVTISGMGCWPQAATCDYFHQHHGGRIPDGMLMSVVPAAPDAWITALETFGTMSFGDVAAAAIRFARDGFPMYPMMRERLEGAVARLRRSPSSAAVFLPDDRLPAVGETFIQADLGATLQYLADAEKAVAGKGREAGLQAAREAFYQGDVSARMIRQQEELGGLMTRDDMARFRVTIDPPARTRFHDIDIYGMGPLSQGPMVMQALNILEGIDLKAMGHNSADYLHAVAEALKLAAADREAYFGDPLFVDVPLDTLLSKDYAASRRAMLRRQEAWPEMPPPGAVNGRVPEPWTPDPTSHLEEKPLPTGGASATSFFCVLDKAGNVFAATPSDGLLHAPIVPGLGLCVSMWGSRGYTNPAHPSSVAPGKRTKMSSNPALAIRPGKLVMPFGSPGAEVLGQAMIQAFLNVAVFDMDPQSAVEAARFASYSWPASTIPHAYRPGAITIEESIGTAVGEDLANRGHDVGWWPERKWSAGSVCMIAADPATGLKVGGADPRRTAYAIGW